MTKRETKRRKQESNKFNEGTIDAFRQLRTRVQFIAPDARVVSIVGDQANVKSQSSIAFANSLALANHRVLLIDADLQSKLLSKHFDLKVTEGFNNLLGGGEFKDTMIKRVKDDAVDVLPVAEVLDNSIDLIDLRSLQTTFEKLKDNYDYIVIDTLPLSLGEDAYLISKISDIAVFIATENETKIASLNYYHSRFSESGINLIGSVFVKQ